MECTSTVRSVCKVGEVTDFATGGNLNKVSRFTISLRPANVNINSMMIFVVPSPEISVFYLLSCLEYQPFTCQTRFEYIQTRSVIGPARVPFVREPGVINPTWRQNCCEADTLLKQKLEHI